jgi:DNA processing protein
MARGVDTASHRSAISAKGKTLAVFGTGVDVIYPKENSRLSEQILALAELSFPNFRWEPSPRRRTFPFATAS